MAKLLLISNKRPEDPGGRAEKIDTRQRMLEERGWEVVVSYVPQTYPRSFLPSIYRCWRHARKENVDVVHSISNPMHLHLIGLLIAFITSLPWLAEFRDPMVKNPDRKEGSVKTHLAQVVESMVVRFADQVVWTNGTQIEDGYFSEMYPNIPENRVQKLPFLGFESAKFESAPTKNYNTTTITYAGSFYEGWIEPYELLEGFSEYVERNGTSEDEITLQFYGDWTELYQEEVKDLGLSGFVETHEFVAHDEIIPVLKGSDIVVYIGGDEPENRLNIPAKIWDYMGARSPILAVVDSSFRVSQLIEKKNLGISVDPDDTEAIADGIEILVSERFDYTSDQAIFDNFSRAHQLDALAEVLNSVYIDDSPS